MKRLFEPIDAAILAYFRIAFGCLMAWEMLRFYLHGRIEARWITPEFHFSYLGFSWIEPMAGQGMYWVCGLMFLGSLGVALGLFYRLSALTFATGMSYLFLLEQSDFVNHFYLMCLLGWIAVILPAHHCFSIDALWRRKLRAETVPAWTLYLLRFQLGIVYFYGGLAKLNSDWLRGEPMRIWLGNRADWAVTGTFFQSEFAPWLFSYGGLAIDLLLVPALLWKRTRLAAFVVAVLFHLTNNYLFTIGIFPWMSIALTALFFSPSWPRRLLGLRQNKSEAKLTSPQTGVLLFLSLYVSWQVLMPLRHWLYPGDASWTEEGHHFAWRMMLRHKSGVTQFLVTDPASKAHWELDPRAYLTERQLGKMSGRPDLIHQLALHIKGLMVAEGYPETQVRAISRVRLNDHSEQLLIDPEIDLAAQPRDFRHAEWILPLKRGL